MYRRTEHIAEENLDWDKSQTVQEKIQKKDNITFSTRLKSKQSVWHSIATFDMQKESKSFLEKNMQLSSVMGVLLLPYFVGFVIAYLLFYTYGNMSLLTFIDLKKEFILLQLWSIGAYLFITLGVLWAFSHIIKHAKKLVPMYGK